MKKVIGVFSSPQSHLVGDGFPVRSLFTYQNHGKALSPFLLLDYAGPVDFPPTGHPRGVGQHPHRGFETVTIVYNGEVEHRDSTGQGGVISTGDVQWMTAGSGIIHEEFHSEAFTRSGGVLEMLQLWVNLPAKDKMAAPKYQPILSADIPTVALPGEAGSMRIIAGSYAGTVGPASTFTPLHVWDIRLNGRADVELPAADGWNTALVVLRGAIHVNRSARARDAQLVLLDPNGANLSVEAEDDAALLMLSGQPINEPVAGQGPFVMNTQAEIVQAIEDYNSGRFGQIPPRTKT